MIDSRIPWLSVGVSSTDLDSASSLSLLHSIYGSQASQLPFSDYDSETSFPGTRSECPQTSASVQRRQRPKSSPAATLAARELAARERQQQRPGGATGAGRPTTARRRRPTTAAQWRPSSAVPGRRGGSAGRERPKTALGMYPSSSSTVLLDIEEERVAPPTAPVRVTRIPEYFNFWEGKPLLERDYGVQVHQRKAWHRPKSCYGSRFYSQRYGDRKGGRKGEGQGLETVVEREGSLSGSGEGDRKALRGQRGGEVEADISKKGDGDDLGDGHLGDGDLGDGLGKDSRGDGEEKDSPHRDERNTKGKGNRDSKNSLKERWAHRKGAWETEDEVESDDYFKQREMEGGLLPTILSTSNLCSLEDPHGCSVGSKFREMHEDSSTERHDLLPSLQPPNQLTKSRSTGRDKENKGPSEGCKREQHVKKLPVARVDPQPRKALASTSWLDGGRSSNRTTRFELPMDLRQLENMSPLVYLRNHTVISERRMAHCSRVFTKLDKDRDSRINRDDQLNLWDKVFQCKWMEIELEELIVGLIEVHHHCITADQARSVLEVVRLPGDQQVDVQLFAAICCIAERMHNLYYLPIVRREVIETVDFEALEWKLRGCTISPTLRTLFAQL